MPILRRLGLLVLSVVVIIPLPAAAHEEFLTGAIVSGPLAGAGAAATAEVWFVGLVQSRPPYSFLSFTACVSLSTPAGADEGCTAVPSAGTFVDPYAITGAIRVLVPSANYAGAVLGADLVLRAVEDDPYALAGDVSGGRLWYYVDPRFPGPSAEFAYYADVTRVAVAHGAVTSSVLGAGTMVGADAVMASDGHLGAGVHIPRGS
jgi:hypothetical protein